MFEGGKSCSLIKTELSKSPNMSFEIVDNEVDLIDKDLLNQT